MNADSSEDYKAPMNEYERPEIIVRPSAAAKGAFHFSLFNVVYFLVVHTMVEAILFLGRGAGDEEFSALERTVFFVLPSVGIVLSAIGAWIAWLDLRKPDRDRNLSLTALVISLALIGGLLVLLTLLLVLSF